MRPDCSSPFSKYNIDETWAYADYKYMIEMLNENLLDPLVCNHERFINSAVVLEIIVFFSFFQCIDWSAFGFAERTAKDSTMWLGTKGAYTPCHYDSYGYNLVAQIHGT
jgi:HSPB1-associated protein 1